MRVEQSIKRLSTEASVPRNNLIHRFKITNYKLNQILGKNLLRSSYRILKHPKKQPFFKLHQRA
jgi:hypothetical protein